MTTHGGSAGSGPDLEGSGAEPLGEGDPQAIGPIPLLGRLGSGGMGRVYLGSVEGRYAAVKQVLPQFTEDTDFQRHFGHELDNLARLPEQATAPLLAADREARPPWLATAYVPGLTLDRVLAVNGGPLDTARLWLLLRETAAGVRAVHELDMVHRDLKPSNLMLTARGATLIDFGIARAAFASRPVPGTKALRGAAVPDAASGTNPRRYRRFVPFLVPLVLAAGATTAVELLPYLSSPSEAVQGARTPAASEAPGSPSPSPSATPDPAPVPSSAAAPSPSASPSSSRSGGSTRKAAPAPTPTLAKSHGPRCVFTAQNTCTSNDPTVELTSSGGWTNCTFTFTTDWGDGTTTYTDTTGTGSTDVHKVYATHHYPHPGTYTINVRAVTDAGLCLATGATLTFTLTP